MILQFNLTFTEYPCLHHYEKKRSECTFVVSYVSGDNKFHQEKGKKGKSSNA